LKKRPGRDILRKRQRDEKEKYSFSGRTEKACRRLKACFRRKKEEVPFGAARLNHKVGRDGGHR
jgi:hypothetical protein